MLSGGILELVLSADGQVSARHDAELVQFAIRPE